MLFSSEMWEFAQTRQHNTRSYALAQVSIVGYACQVTERGKQISVGSESYHKESPKRTNEEEEKKSQ